jgi:hypothetical protein
MFVRQAPSYHQNSTHQRSTCNALAGRSRRSRSIRPRRGDVMRITAGWLGRRSEYLAVDGGRAGRARAGRPGISPRRADAVVAPARATDAGRFPDGSRRPRRGARSNVGRRPWSARSHLVRARAGPARVRRWLIPSATMVEISGPPAGFRIPSMPSPADLAAALGLGHEELAWLADERRMNVRASEPKLGHYHHRWVPKARGGWRLLEAPKPRLKRIQRWLLDEVLSEIPLSDVARRSRFPPASAARGPRARAGVSQNCTRVVRAAPPSSLRRAREKAYRDESPIARMEFLLVRVRGASFRDFQDG